jgi:GntR family transcriptional regulator
MDEPAYMRIAAELGENIRTGALTPGSRLPSYTDLASDHDVSPIVIRQAIALLRRRGLVRTVERSGTFVTEQPTLIRTSPERQLETAARTFVREAGDSDVLRQVRQMSATADVAEGLGIAEGDEVTHVHTRITANGVPVTVSDYYEPLDITRGTPIEDPRDGEVAHNPTVRFPAIGYSVDVLDETLSLRPPPAEHAAFLNIPAAEPTFTIRQQFRSGERTVQMSNITYPIDRYAAFAFRMALPTAGETSPS